VSDTRLLKNVPFGCGDEELFEMDGKLFLLSQTNLEVEMKYCSFISFSVRIFLYTFLLVLILGLFSELLKATLVGEILLVVAAFFAILFTIEMSVIWFLAWYHLLFKSRYSSPTDKLVGSALNLLLGPIGSVYILYKK